MTEREERIAWLEAILSDPDCPRFYSADQMEEMRQELAKLKEKP